MSEDLKVRLAVLGNQIEDLGIELNNISAAFATEPPPPPIKIDDIDLKDTLVNLVNAIVELRGEVRALGPKVFTK